MTGVQTCALPICHVGKQWTSAPGVYDDTWNAGTTGSSSAPREFNPPADTRDEKLVADGKIKKHETVVLFNTGGALKYLDLLRS